MILLSVGISHRKAGYVVTQVLLPLIIMGVKCMSGE